MLAASLTQTSTMEKLLASFKTLSHLATQIFFFIEIHETYTENADYLNKVKFKGHYLNLSLAKAISGSLLNYSLIISSSFFDEYNEEFNSARIPEYANRINRLKKLTKPVLKRLNKWTDFKDYRNQLLAHNLRINGKSIFDNDFGRKDYKIPFTNSESILLANMVKIIMNCIATEFPDLLQKLDWTENILNKTNFEFREVNVLDEVDEIWEQINLIKSTLS